MKKNKFEKENPWRYTTNRKEPLKAPLTIRLTEKQREQIKKVPGWQELLRNYIDKLIEENVDCT